MTHRELSDHPHINWRHVDGPLLVCRDGSLHWLSKIECLRLRLGFTTPDLLDAKYSMEPRRG